MAGGLSTTHIVLGRPGGCCGARHVASSRYTDVVALPRSVGVLALFACPHLRARPFCRELVAAYLLLGIWYGPTRTPLGTCVPTGVIRAHGGPPLVPRPLGFSFVCSIGDVRPCRVFFGPMGPWRLRPSLGPSAFGSFLVDYWSTFLKVFPKPSTLELEALSRDFACKTVKQL